MTMVEVKMPHEGHEKHLCCLENIGYVQEHFEEYKNLVRDGKYVCVTCGRVAANPENLCSAEKL